LKLTANRVATLAAIITITSTAGCGGGGGQGEGRSEAGDGSTQGMPAPEGRPINDATFTYALRTDPGSLDYALNGQSVLSEVLPYAYDTLVHVNPKREIVPYVATKWDVTPTKATFTIRPDVTCADGSRVTPSVIAKGFKFFKSPKVQTPVFGSVTDWQVSSDDAAGTVTFRFGAPVGFALHSLAQVPIVCGKGLDDRKLLERGTSGSGPYVLSEAASNDHYTFVRRDGYTWGPGDASTDVPGLPAEVVLRVISEQSTATNLLLAGEIDAENVDGTNADRVEAAGKGVVRERATNPQVWFNHAPKHPTSETAVRRALTMAIDRATAAKVGRGAVGNSLVSPLTNPCAASSTGEAIPAYDMQAAASALDAAGWHEGPDGVRAKGGEPLRLDVLAAASVPSEWRAAAELIAKSWRELGVDVRMRTLADNALSSALFGGEWDVISMAQIGAPNPAKLVANLSGPPIPDGPNLLSVDNPEYERLAEQALQTTEQSAACKLWGEAEEALYEQADVIPIFEGDRAFAYANDVRFSVTSLGIVPTSMRMYGR
jgi:peptide/nickel transport system substrate-binding protein